MNLYQICIHIIVLIAGLYYSAKLFNNGEILHTLMSFTIVIALNVLIFNLFGNKK